MNMIACSRNCCHQQDGYCALTIMTSLSAANDKSCGYFESPGAYQRTPLQQQRYQPRKMRKA